MRYDHLYVGVRCDGFVDVLDAGGCFQLKELVDAPMRIANNNIPCGIICALCQLRGPAIGKMTVIQPICIINFEQLSLYTVHQAHEPVGIVTKLIYRLNKAEVV